MNPSKKDKPAATPEKEKKPKLVRDSFTLPKNEYAAIDAIKQRALQMALAVKKSEVVRAALMALATLDDAQLKAALAAVPTLKTGRPVKETPPPAPAGPAKKTAAKVKAAAPAAAKPAAAPKAPAKRALAARKTAPAA